MPWDKQRYSKVFLFFFKNQFLCSSFLPLSHNGLMHTSQSRLFLAWENSEILNKVTHFQAHWSQWALKVYPCLGLPWKTKTRQVLTKAWGKIYQLVSELFIQLSLKSSFGPRRPPLMTEILKRPPEGLDLAGWLDASHAFETWNWVANPQVGHGDFQGPIA